MSKRNNLFAEDVELEEIPALSEADTGTIINTQEDEETQDNTGYKVENLKELKENTVIPKPTKRERRDKDKSEDKVEVTSKGLEDLIKAITESVSKPVIAQDYTQEQKNEDKKYMQMYAKEQMDLYKNSAKVKVSIPSYLAPVIGSTYTFLFNGIAITLMCDDKEHLYPDYVADEIVRKLKLISEHNTPKVFNNKMDTI